MEGPQAPPPKDADLSVDSNASPESPEKRITAEDAANAKAEKEAAMTNLMDEMEASVETQGQWFVKLGTKIQLTDIQREARSRLFGLGKKTVERQVEAGFDDQRVLLLRSVVEGMEGVGDKAHKYKEYTMVTRAGILTHRSLEWKADSIMDGGDIKGYHQPSSIALDRLIDGAKPNSKSGFMEIPEKYPVRHIPGEKGVFLDLFPDMKILIHVMY